MNYNENSELDLDSFNKLIESEFSKIDTFDELTGSINDIFNNIDDENIYVRKIKYIWNKYKINENSIKFNCDQVFFIEENFEGNYENYLIFIIPRITKLNRKHLNKLIKEEDLKIEKKDLLSEDEDYIKILEININDLQIEISNLSQTISSKMGYLEDKIDTIENKIDDIDKKYDNLTVIQENKDTLINNIQKVTLENSKSINKIQGDFYEKEKSIETLKNSIESIVKNEVKSLSNEVVNLKDNLTNQGKFSKNSIIVLEQRISKIIELIK